MQKRPKSIIDEPTAKAAATREIFTHDGNALFSLRKTVGKVSPILVTLTSHSDSDFESSNISLKENKPDGESRWR